MTGRVSYIFLARLSVGFLLTLVEYKFLANSKASMVVPRSLIASLSVKLNFFNRYKRGIKENATDGSGGDVGALAFGTRASGDYIKERMRIDSSGNLGIGTTTPSEILDVVGNIKARDKITSTTFESEFQKQVASEI